MKSIRLSLLVYFLGLLAVALGAVSVLAYRTTQRTLVPERESTAEVIESHYREQCDKALLDQARALARLLQFRFHPNRARNREYHALGLSGVGFLPQGHLHAAAWAFQAYRGPQSWELIRTLTVTDLAFDEEDLEQHLDRDLAEYFQIDSTWKTNNYRSSSLIKAGASLKTEPTLFARSEVLDWKFDDVTLAPGVTLRRVILKAPLRLTPPPAPPRPPSPGPSSRSRPSPDSGSSSASAPRPEPTDRPSVYIQCAYDVVKHPHPAAFAKFEQQRDEEMARLESEVDASLDTLRNHLLAIGLATFAATVVGGFFLVRLGLTPLVRLSDAVSKVSERDFRLRFEEPRLASELRPIVDRLRKALDQLRHAFDREKQAAADISHELRTPVAALLTTIDVALRKPRGSEEYREVLAECRESGHQIFQLVERLLTLARLDAGVDRLRTERFDAAGLADQCAALVRPLAEARGVTLRLHNAGPAELNADPAKLREVITNLLHNAIEYNRPQGSVDLTVARHNGSLCVEVRDTGVGIAPEARAHLFERFYRADPSRHAEGLHAGLGLAIVKGYVDLMGGSIAVDSVEGSGSTFRVELPAA